MRGTVSNEWGTTPENKNMTQRKGFTLIELLTVIAIIAILAAIITPAIMRAKVGAARSQDISNMNAIRSALQQYRVDQGGYPPALLGYVTLYTSGPNIGQVIPANALNGFLYSKRINSLSTLRPNYNRELESATTNASWPGTIANAAACASQAFDGNTTGFVTDISQTGGDPTPTTNANEALNFYRVSGYDVSEGTSPTNVRRWEIRYTLFWTGYGLGNGTCGLGNAADNPRQLGYEDPPEDTVITWNAYYRDFGVNPPPHRKDDIVLFLGGAARPTDSRNVHEQAWGVRP